ncbi:MAG: hypothetical protein DI629_07095 [Mesorhizobium amorphae]|nr:MAG: hypothetical protein DI629_07095 [Mesorhizobium amorphae]
MFGEGLGYAAWVETMSEAIKPHKERSLRRSLGLVVGGLAAATALIVGFAPSIGHTIAMGGHTESQARAEVVVGNDVLTVPLNMIRSPTARSTGTASRLDLYWRWPALDGYSEAARGDFNNADGSRNIVFATIEPRGMSRDMSGRLEPVYAPLLEDGVSEGPAGLSVRNLRRDSGYTDETLVVGPAEGGARFVARCLAGPAAETSLAPCERDLFIGKSLSLTYRFPKSLLGNWRELDGRIRERAASLLPEAG